MARKANEVIDSFIQKPIHLFAMPRTVLGKFRLIGFVEGLSYLLLLGVAVPKWLSLFVMPTAIRVIGMTHGVLFILYCLLLFMAMRQYKWSLGYTIYLFFMALVPFGTFYTDRRLRELAVANHKARFLE